MKTALITGVTGQDGSYMAERLLAQGVKVVGVVRDPERAQLIPSLRARIDLVDWDFSDSNAIRTIMARRGITDIYNFAAFSSGAGMFDHPIEIGRTNGLTVALILEAIRQVNPRIRFCQASSSEMFGNTSESPQSERSPFCPRTPYGAAKLYAHSMVNVYRQNFGMFVCSAILFNHESPRRGTQFISRKVTRAAAAIKCGCAQELVLETLDARRDWGYAGDYVEAMQRMLEYPRPDDYVIATGITHSVRDLCACAFGHLGLDYVKYVRVEPRFGRATELAQLVGDASKARAELKWKPTVEFEALIRMMVDADMELLATAAC